jgi:hypothetical protein
MVATMEDNEVVRALFTPGIVEVTGGKDWAAIVEKLIATLPLDSMRGYSSPTGMVNFDFLWQVHEITGYGYSAVDEFSTVFCDGLTEKKHVTFCFFLRKKESPRRLRLEFLCMSRSGNFYIAESQWDIRKNSDGEEVGTRCPSRICYLRKFIFRSTDVESVCNQYMFALGSSGNIPIRPPGLAICYRLLNMLSKTGRELSFQLGDVKDGARTVRGVLQRLDSRYEP